MHLKTADSNIFFNCSLLKKLPLLKAPAVPQYCTPRIRNGIASKV